MKTRQKVRMSYSQAEEEILHFSLQGLIPEGHIFAFNMALGMLSHLAIDEGRATMLTEQPFTTAEVSVLLPLLEAYPYYCPHEVLVASFNQGRATEAGIALTRKRLQEASRVDGAWDQELRPARNVLSRCRLKTRAMGFDIAPIVEVGYILMVM